MSNGTVRILLVEDNPGDARLIREMLAESQEPRFAIDWVTLLSAGLERLAGDGIDLVLLDLGLPDSRGLDTFVRAYAQAPQVPFVVLSGLSDETVALSAVRAGAQDYLVKGQTDGDLLLRAIRYATERKKAEEDLRRANEELRREVEERRGAEMAVEAERQRLFALLDGLPVMVHLKEPDFSIRFANRIFRKIFGDWEGKRCFEVIQGGSEPCENCPTKSVFESGTANEAEWTVPNRNRNQTLQIYNYPFFDVDGSPQVLTLGFDITQRKQAEEALKESERQYRLLVGTIPAVVFKGYADWSIDFFDDKVQELTGYRKEEFNSRRLLWSDLILREDLDQTKEAFVKALKDDGAYVREYRIRSKDGQIRWIQARGRISLTPDDRIDHVSGVFFDISEHKAAEAALRQSEARLAEAQKIARLGNWEWDLKRNVALWSDELFRIFHLPPGEQGLSYEEFCEYLVPEDRERLNQAVVHALAGKEPYPLDVKVVLKDGTVLTIAMGAKLVVDEGGKPVKVYGTIQDITARQEAEEALRQSQARLAEAQRIARLGHWECDLQSNRVIWSEEVYRIFGLKPEGFTPAPRSIFRYVHPEDRERVSRGLNEALAGVKPYNLVNRLVRPDGSVRFIHSQAEAVFENGKPRRMLGTAQDITERRIAEKRLQDSEARFRAIFEGAALGIVLSDMEGRIMAANAAQHKMLGYPDGELRGKTFLEITHPDDRARNLELSMELKNGLRDNYDLEKRLLRRDGADFWARVNVSLVRGLEGEPRCCIGTTEDVTARKEAREKLRESEKSLRHLASQLMTAQEDERKRISRELHDELGQSLLVLKLQARAIEKGLIPEQQDLRTESQEMLSNLDKVVDNVRRLSRDLSPTILEDLGLSAAMQYLIRGFSKHYHIECSIQETNIDDLFPLEAQVTIYRIFQECLTNIGKHSHASHLTISINKNAGSVSFLIQDNGRGFNQAQRRSQAPDQGMGLAAMEERAHMVGGVLAIWSQEGVGTRIAFDIPYSPKK